LTERIGFVYVRA